MNINSLILLLISVLSFQSIAAVSDIHESHQSGVEHLEFDHNHENEHLQGNENGPAETKVTIDSDKQTTQTSFDCHHCCHCHGVNLSSLLPSGLSLVFFDANHSWFNLNQITKNAHNSRLLRPPQI